VKRLLGRTAASVVLVGLASFAAAVPAHAADYRKADLKVWADPDPQTIRNGPLVVTVHLVDLGPDITLTGDVKLHYRAPEGTEFVTDYGTYSKCQVTTPHRDFWCYSPGQYWPPPKDAGPNTGFWMELKIVSTVTTQGEFWVEYPGDPDPSNNWTPILIGYPSLRPPAQPTQPAQPARPAEPTAAPTPSASVEPSSSPTPSTAPSTVAPTASSSSVAPAPSGNTTLLGGSVGTTVRWVARAVGAAVLVLALFLGARRVRRRKASAASPADPAPQDPSTP